MEVVVDSMVLINAFNKDSEHFEEAQKIIKENKILLCLPQNILEFVNVCSKFMSKEEIKFLILRFLSVFDYDFVDLPDLSLATEIFLKEENIKIFDAIILAFAINRELPLISFDKRLIKVYRKYIG